MHDDLMNLAQSAQGPQRPIMAAIDAAMITLINRTDPKNGLDRTALFLTKIKEVMWRTTTNSAESAISIWRRFEQEATLDTGWIELMAAEFAIRADLTRNVDQVVEEISICIAQPGVSTALPMEYSRFKANREQYAEVFKNNWWLIFLYCLSISSHRWIEQAVSGHDQKPVKK